MQGVVGRPDQLLSFAISITAIMTSTAPQHKDPYGQAIREQSECMDRSFREHDERQRVAMRRPFLDERLMTNENPPNCRAQDFSTPRLRKCPFLFENLSSVDIIIPDPDPFSGNCDGGADGYNWKVAFKGVEGGPFVMKMVSVLTSADLAPL